MINCDDDTSMSSAFFFFFLAVHFSILRPNLHLFLVFQSRKSISSTLEFWKGWLQHDDVVCDIDGGGDVLRTFESQFRSFRDKLPQLRQNVNLFEALIPRCGVPKLCSPKRRVQSRFGRPVRLIVLSLHFALMPQMRIIHVLWLPMTFVVRFKCSAMWCRTLRASLVWRYLTLWLCLALTLLSRRCDLNCPNSCMEDTLLRIPGLFVD